MYYLENMSFSRKELVRLSGLPNGFVSAAIGFVFGLWFIGFKNVFPWNLEWLNGKGDGSYDQLNFEFFRKNPLIQWPITGMPNYVAGSGQVLGSGNGLFAIPAKIIGQFVPGNFQYLGIWIVFCFCLQGLFAERLLSRLTDSKTLQILAAMNFIVSPILLYRVGVLSHFQLGAHWLILAALYFYFDENFRRKQWALLLLLAVLINIYITAMVVVIFIASNIKNVLYFPKSGILRIASDFLVPLAALVFGFIFMGYASYGGNAKGSNFFRLSPIAFVNSGDISGFTFSTAIKSIPSKYLSDFFLEEPESFQYLGTGIVIGLFLSVLLVNRFSKNWHAKSIAPLAVSVIGLFIFALSNRISISGYELAYWWPQVFHDLRQVFRASSRFGWPLYYLLVATSFSYFAYRLSFTKKVVFAVALLLVSIADGGNGIQRVRNELATSNDYISSIKDGKWSDLVSNKEKIYIYPNFDLDSSLGTSSYYPWVERWFDLAKFAVANDLHTNFGGTPRPISDFVLTENLRMRTEFDSGLLDSKTIYIIGDTEYWETLKEQLLDVADSYQIDGLNVIIAKP
jgi:hypothetical protein